MDERPFNQSCPTDGRAKRQFSLRSLMLSMVGVSAFLSLLSAGWYTAAFWFLAASGALMMAVDIILGRVSRTWATGLLMVGISYAAFNGGVFLATMSVDAFAIFHLTYIILVVFAGPGIIILGSIFVAATYKRLDWLGVIGFDIWIGCTGFAHLWVIAQCSASV